MSHRALCTGLIVAALAIVSVTRGVCAQAPQGLVRGKVVSVSGNELLITSEGELLRLRLADDWLIAVTARATLEDIQPGSFVGTTNVDVVDGGLATEVHIFPPGSRLGEGQRTMHEASETRMTNGTVTAHARSTDVAAGDTIRMTNGGIRSVHRQNDGESVLELQFPGGSRRVRVPPGALITTFTPVDRSTLKSDILISARVVTNASGDLEARVLTTGPDGSAPAR